MLDGPTHNYPSRQKRDAFVNDLTEYTEMPLVHLYPNRLRETDYVKSEIDKQLALYIKAPELGGREK